LEALNGEVYSSLSLFNLFLRLHNIIASFHN
jgi:hypothetical protein